VAANSKVDSLDSCGSANAPVNTEDFVKLEKPFLYVHQDQWQKDLLLRYGNLLTLMDATYKITKYSIPLFFLCVKTNVVHSFGEFIV